MKKILFLLLLISSLSYGQTIAPTKVKITANTVSQSAPFVNVQEIDGYVNKINKSDLVDVIESASAINLPSPGVAGKIYVTKDNNNLYRWNGTFYDELALTDISGKVDKVAGKGLSTEDYTTAEKTKLSGIQAGATANSTDAQLRDRATHTGTQAISTVMGLQAAIDAKINLTLIGANNGVTPLGPGGKVPFAYLPASLMIYKSMWNPATNTPTLSDGTGVAGWVYKANASGTVDLGSGNIAVVANDFIIHNGTKWEWSSGTDDVVSVNGQQGVVSLNTSHIPEVTNKRYQTDAQQANNNATSPIQQQLDGKEPIISPKNSAFNKNFGTTAGTVVEGGTLGTNAYSSTAYLPLTGNAVTASELYNATNGGTDLNTATVGKHTNYSSGWYNSTGGPSSATYGTAYNFGGTNASTLSLQVLADVNHNSTSSTKDFYFRTGNNLGFQNDWKKMWHDGNFNPANYLPLSGGDLVGYLKIGGSGENAIGFNNALSGDLYIGAREGTRTLEIRNGNYASPNYDACGIKTGYGNFTGSLTASGFFQSSDRRLKYIHKRDGDVAYFTWKDGRDDKMHIGWIAQEVRKQFPDQVQKNDDGYLSVSYIEILVAKVQELTKRIEQLEKSK